MSTAHSDEHLDSHLERDGLMDQAWFGEGTNLHA